jgi:prepilin-type N-terminal cleavage/methylation domain-containing protein
MKKGFTLVELLVTISIIAILASLAIVSFTGAQKQARDTRRKSDLKQFQTALEVYANKNNSLYPSYTGITDTDTVCTELGIDPCPNDPKEVAGDPHYNYRSIGGSGAGAAQSTDYVLWVGLEGDSSEYWVVCSNGKVGKNLSFWSAGVGCPL